VIVNWDCEENWLTEHRKIAERAEIADHLIYYRLQNCNTHVIWTAHPNWLKFNDLNKYVEMCVGLAKTKLNIAI
jgi:hypothetical protein